MKNKILKSLLAITLVVFAFNSFAYNYVIFGKITDSQNGLGLPNQYVNIINADSVNGTTSNLWAITDQNGDYFTTLEITSETETVFTVNYNDACGFYFSEVVVVYQEGSSEINFVSCENSVPEDSCMAYFWYESYDNTVNFYDASFTYEPINEWTWEFGDGTSSSEQNPTHTFGYTGEFLVNLTISGDQCQSTYSQFIYNGNDTTWNGCYASFWYYNELSDPYTYYFENYSSVGELSNWTWDFGDNTTSNDYMPVHTYSQPGVYGVTLTVEDSICGFMAYTDYVYVDENPVFEDCFADFYYSTDSSGYSFDFFNASWSIDSTYTAFWDFGDGEFSEELNPSHTYTADGQFIVTLTISSETCTSTTEMSIYVGENNWYPEYCQAFFFTDYNWENIYDINFYDFSYGNGEILNYTWDFGDGYGSNLQNPHHVYDQSGEYLVTLTIFSETCSSLFSQYIYIEDWNWSGTCQSLFFPNFDETLSVQFFDLSFPTPTNWNWNFGDNFTSTEQNPIHTFAEPGIYYVTLETSTDSSCYSAFAMEIEIYELNTKSTTYGGRIIAAHAIHSNSSTNINENNETVNNVNVYPNPVVNELNINISDNFDNAQVQIFSITGQLIYSNSIENSNLKVDTSLLTSGLYVARITIDGNISNLKFIK